MTAVVDTTIDDLRKMVPADVRKELDKADFEETLNLIDAAINRGDDIWELVGDAANDERDGEDMKRWNSVDLAARVEKRYGEDMVGEFAKRANLSKRSAKERRMMGMFYTDRSRRANFLRDNPNQTYSHLRAATRAADETTAYRLLERASKRTWTVDQFEHVITRWKGITGQPLRKREPSTERQQIAEFEVKAEALFGIEQFAEQAADLDGSETIIVLAFKKVVDTGQGG